MSDLAIKRVIQGIFLVLGIGLLASVDPRISAGVIAVTIFLVLNDA